MKSEKKNLLRFFLFDPSLQQSNASQLVIQEKNSLQLFVSFSPLFTASGVKLKEFWLKMMLCGTFYIFCKWWGDPF